MSENLTPQQQQAVENHGGKLLVSAAAGSGKTKVLVDRVLRYLTDPINPANLDDFLIITYTKAAASELRGKIAAKLTEKIAQQPENRHLQRQMQRLYLAKISTVHSFCADILKEYAHRLDLGADFRVADENECSEIQSQVLAQLLEDAYDTAGENLDFCAFIDSQGFGRDDRQIPQVILKVYNSARCQLNPKLWLEECLKAADIREISDASQTVWGEYLIQDLRSYLDMQIDAIEKSAQLAEKSDGMEKPAVLLRDTLYQLKELRNCDSWDSIVEKSKIEYGRLTFSKKCQDFHLAEQIKAVRNACKTGLSKKLRAFQDDSAQILSDLQQSQQALSGLIRLVEEFERRYTNRKKIRRVLDFSDLEHKMLDLLTGKSRMTPTVIADEIGNRFREIMVDEYQDSNEVQDRIFRALTDKRHNCFMVGDVKQSIYQFRLADPDIFIKMYNSYLGPELAKTGEGRKILLSSNFRSAGGVISAVNDVFSNCMSETVGGINYGEDEMLREGIPHVAIDEPEVELYGLQVKEDTYAEEAAFVAKRIKELLNGKHVVRQGDSLRTIMPGDIAILLRSPGSVGAEFCYALEQAGIPCRSGGNVDLLQTEEIAILRSLLQIISNPLQDIPLIAVLSSRIFGFDANDLAQIRSVDRKISYFDALSLSNSNKCIDFLHVLNNLRNDSKMYSLTQLIHRIFKITAMDSMYAAMPDGQSRRENLLTFMQVASDFEASGRRNLDQFLAYLEVMEEKGLIRPDADTNNSSVTVMSIHKSKGLEFPVVFLCGLSRSFNQESVYAQVLSDKQLGLGLCNVDLKKRIRYPGIAKRAIATKMLSDSISEEMRVLYVAMTRPKDRLIMTYAAKNLESDLLDIALRSGITSKGLMTSEVNCPGQWVLQTAMKRTEAGAFFAISEKPEITHFKEPAWMISVVESDVGVVNVISADNSLPILSEELLEKLKISLNFRYAYLAATNSPSKITATQLKGRFKDQEISENTSVPLERPLNFRLPTFASKAKHGKEYGNAIHAVMQYINYESCGDIKGVLEEITRLVHEKLISAEQGNMVSPEKIFRLFASPLGRKMRTSENVIREFKFSILDDCQVYYPDVIDEKILLQGVVDCAMIEHDGITVIDFKTDFVTENSIDAVVTKYRPQVKAYAKALSRIYRKPVLNTFLYLFHLDQFVSI